MRVCKYLKQRVRRIDEKNGQSFKDVSKNKRETKTNEKIEFTGCGKVIVEMPELVISVLRMITNAGKHLIQKEHYERLLNEEFHGNKGNLILEDLVTGPQLQIDKEF